MQPFQDRLAGMAHQDRVVHIMIGGVGPGNGIQRNPCRTRDDFRHPLIRVGEMPLVKIPEPVQAGGYCMLVHGNRINQIALGSDGQPGLALSSR
jgi:hypothetical protein